MPDIEKATSNLRSNKLAKSKASVDGSSPSDDEHHQAVTNELAQECEVASIVEPIVTPNTMADDKSRLEHAVDALLHVVQMNEEETATLVSNGNGAEETDDNLDFNRVFVASGILKDAKQLDDHGKFADALYLYRQGVDILLTELFEVEGTHQSRSYLHSKCNQFMDRIDQLKEILYSNIPLPDLIRDGAPFEPMADVYSTYPDIDAQIVICLRCMVATVADEDLDPLPAAQEPVPDS